MNNQTKAIVIGTSLSGKTTLIRHLRQRTSLPIREIDEEIAAANNGQWPEMDYKNMVVVPPIIRNVLSSDCVVFFTNSFYFSLDDLAVARASGFEIIQLMISIQEMTRRNTLRVIEEGYEDQSRWLEDMLTYQHEVQNAGLVDKILDGSQSTKEVARELLSFLELNA